MLNHGIVIYSGLLRLSLNLANQSPYVTAWEIVIMAHIMTDLLWTGREVMYELAIRELQLLHLLWWSAHFLGRLCCFQK